MEIIDTIIPKKNFEYIRPPITEYLFYNGFSVIQNYSRVGPKSGQNFGSKIFFEVVTSIRSPKLVSSLEDIIY